MPKFEIPTQATRPLYAGVGATDVVVGYVRGTVADVQKRFLDAQKDVQTRIAGFEFQPKELRGQATVVVDALSKDAKARRSAIEARVAELQAEAMALPTKVQSLLSLNAATTTYADLAKRGEALVERIRKQESTQATVTAAKTTSAKARTTQTQATKATKTTAKKTAKTASTTAKKTSTAPTSSAKATVTAAKATVSSATEAAVDAVAKVGD